MPLPGKAKFVTGWFLPVDPGAHPEHPIAPGGPQTPGGPVDPSYGKPIPPDMIWGGGKPDFPPGGEKPPSDAHPEHPIVIPPLVGIWPSPEHPAHPIVLPPEELPPNSGPIFIKGSTDNPITTEAGTLQPPLPSGSLPPSKVAVLVTVVGVEGNRWLTYDNTGSVAPSK